MVSVNSFYGNTSIAQLKVEKILNSRPIKHKTALPPFLNSLLGPSRTWKVFQKQDDAIQFALKRQNSLMAFAFQHSAGQRSFLVCHPIVLWYVYSNRPRNERCSYEVIVEDKPSKIYFDLEFEYSSNPSIDFTKGESMVDILITVFIKFLKDDLNIEANENDFLDLDSSNNEKFSRHLIMNLPHRAFANNYVVGNIVKSVCHKIQTFVSTQNSGQYLFGMTLDKLMNLFIMDRKGVKKLFVDLTVYSKNRHFRLLGSTKLFKNSSLEVSLVNKFAPINPQPHSMFIFSLITYFDTELRLVYFGSSPSTSPTTSVRKDKIINMPFVNDNLDRFILQLIAPTGRIRQKLQIQHKVKFDICGFRYCHNIKREHKSNNIFYIVDLEHLLVYQHCYDPECKEFVSNASAVPPNVLLSSVDDPIIIETADFILSDNELMELMEYNKDIYSKNCNIDGQDAVKEVSDFPDMNLTDSELMDIVTISENVPQYI